MAFGHASLPTRKYAYGVRLAPHDAKLRERFEGFDALMDQMRRAHRFQNALVECELKRRADTEAALRAHDPNLVALYADAEREQEEINRMRAELSAANSAARKLVADPEQAARTRQQATVSAAAWRLHQQARAAAFRDPLVRPALALVDEAADTAKALARTEAVAEGLYWATSLQVMGRVKKSGPPPRFSRWDGEETVSVQFQRKADKSSPKEAVLDSKGNPRIHPRSGRPMMAHTGGGSVSTADMGRANTICWIEPIPLRAPYKFDPKKVVVHFRIGTNDDGTPHMVHLPTVLHRPLAEGAQVKWVHVVMRRVGTRTELRICFDLARPVWDHHPAGADRATEGVVAVSLGWRHIDGMVRVAEWVGDDGARGSVMIPEDLVRQWRYLEKLQSIRDKYFDQWKEGVLNFVRSVQATATGLPQEWIDRAGTLASWNSPARLAGLVWWWKDHRLPGDVDAYRVAEGELVKRRPAANDFYTGGRKQDKHLCDWQCYDPDTEVLTRSGWKRFDSVGLGDEFATVDLGRDRIVYQRPSRVFSKYHSGELVRIGGPGKRVDLMVTPDHRMVVYPGQSSTVAGFKEASELTVWDRIKVRSHWDAVSPDVIVVPGSPSLNGRGLPDVTVPAKALAAFLGWYVSEGSCKRYYRSSRDALVCGVVIYQKKPHNRDKIRLVLQSLPWAFHETDDGFKLSAAQVYDLVSGLGKSPDRFVPQWIKDSGPDLISEFVSAAVSGDGWRSGGGERYSTTSKRLADDMQELYLKMGYGTSVSVKEPVRFTIENRTYKGNHRVYVVNRISRKWASLRNSDREPNFGRIPYEGPVYCATVPNGTLIVRRNGKVAVCGNCGLRQRLIGWRKDFYRHVAIDLSYQYKHVTVAEIDWADIAEEKQVEDGGDPVSKTNRAIAACATLRDHLTRYLDPVTVPADGITVTCHKCDGRMADPGRGRWVTCERCGGEKMDRAENAAENLLSRYLAANPLVSPARV